MSTKLEEFKRTCKKWLIIRDDEYIDVLFGTVFANRLDSKPVWLYLVGPPGCGKTEIVQSWHGAEEAFLLDKLTPRTLVSGMIIDEGQEDPSLLPKLDGKMLVIKDFTTLLESDANGVRDIIGTLRSAYDGTARNVYGTGKEDFYRSKFGLIACVTDALYSHIGLLSELGERCIIYRMPDVSEEERDERALMAAMNVSSSEQETEISLAAKSIFRMKPEAAVLELDEAKHLVSVAGLVARARTHVPRGLNHEVIRIPEVEVHTRLSKQLCDLARGLAMAREKVRVGMEEAWLAAKTGLACVQPSRRKLMEEMLRAGEWATLKDIGKGIPVNGSTVHRWLEDLVILGLVETMEDPNSPPGAFSTKLYRLDMRMAELVTRSPKCSNMELLMSLKKRKQSIKEIE